MIKEIILTLHSDEWEDGDENIKIAKGKYKLESWLTKLKKMLS